jgi:excisionase family DNA binding protein
MDKNIPENTSYLLNVNQAAQFLGVNVGTIRRWARSKVLPGLKVGIRGDWRFTQGDLLTMVKPNHPKGQYDENQ